MRNKLQNPYCSILIERRTTAVRNRSKTANRFSATSMAAAGIQKANLPGLVSGFSCLHFVVACAILSLGENQHVGAILLLFIMSLNIRYSSGSSKVDYQYLARGSLAAIGDRTIL
ncbi:MAG: hypothetical protein Q8Q81_04265 [Oxalobacteraceae bacterium]|nr:hypothetical protein [Oxalobacteraceae bacterium]